MGAVDRVDRGSAVAAPAFTEALLLAAGLLGAVGLRIATGGPAAASSIPAALLFAAALLAVAVAGGVRWKRVSLQQIAVGAGGGLALLAPWLLARHGLALPAAPAASLAVWTPAVVFVAVAEEALLRGALFSAVVRWRGAPVAVAVTSLAFGLMHVPFYGWAALPVDIAVGVWLGGLRLLTGTWAAPAVAHALADVAAGWL